MIWVDEADILAVHDRLLVVHGGAAGVRDLGLLQSALARPRNLAGYRPDAAVLDMAGAYAFGIVGNHPFLDGNKRTGFVAGVLFAELNGQVFTAPEDQAAEAVMALAAGALDEAGYVAFLQACCVSVAA